MFTGSALAATRLHRDEEERHNDNLERYVHRQLDAKMIQRFVKSRLSIRIVHQKVYVPRLRAVKIVMRFIRGWRARRTLRKLKQNEEEVYRRREAEEKRIFMIVKVQSHFRAMYDKRRGVRRMEMERARQINWREREEKRFFGALLTQSSFRRWLARTELMTYRNNRQRDIERDELRQKRHYSAQLIQQWYRRFQKWYIFKQMLTQLFHRKIRQWSKMRRQFSDSKNEQQHRLDGTTHEADVIEEDSNEDENPFAFQHYHQHHSAGTGTNIVRAIAEVQRRRMSTQLFEDAFPKPTSNDHTPVTRTLSEEDVKKATAPHSRSVSGIVPQLAPTSTSTTPSAAPLQAAAVSPKSNYSDKVIPSVSFAVGGDTTDGNSAERTHHQRTSDTPPQPRRSLDDPIVVSTQPQTVDVLRKVSDPEMRKQRALELLRQAELLATKHGDVMSELNTMLGDQAGSSMSPQGAKRRPGSAQAERGSPSLRHRHAFGQHHHGDTAPTHQQTRVGHRSVNPSTMKAKSEKYVRPTPKPHPLLRKQSPTRRQEQPPEYGSPLLKNRAVFSGPQITPGSVYLERTASSGMVRSSSSLQQQSAVVQRLSPGYVRPSSAVPMRNKGTSPLTPNERGLGESGDDGEDFDEPQRPPPLMVVSAEEMAQAKAQQYLQGGVRSVLQERRTEHYYHTLKHEPTVEFTKPRHLRHTA